MAIAVFCVFLYVPSSVAQTDAEQPVSSEELAETDISLIPDSAESSEPEVSVPDPDETDLIGRVNAEMDRRGADDATANQADLSDVTQGAVRSALRAIFALCIVLGLILLTYYSVRRWGKRVPILAGSSLGSVLGRVHLERGTTLHFVKTAGRVLVVGVNGNSVSLVADFEASQFTANEIKDASLPDAAKPFNSDSFLAQLQASSQTMQPSAKQGEEIVDEDEIAVLRGDIQRLQQYLREESREPRD